MNRAIQNGLRYLWTVQSNRAAFDTNAAASWGAYLNPFTALVVQAFQDHGYRLPDSSEAVGESHAWVEVATGSATERTRRLNGSAWTSITSTIPDSRISRMLGT